jgi:hypothetical protein
MTKEKTVSDILSTIQTELKTPKGQDNKFGNYKYRKAEDILLAYKEEIKTEDKFPKGITLKHKMSIELIGTRTFVKCVSILAFNGQQEEAEGFAELEISKKGMDLAQLTGAATSYAKKYALGNLFAIDDSKDDPDAGENKEEKPKNQFSGMAKVADADMKATLAQANKNDALRVKGLLSAAKSLEDIQDIVDYEKKTINKLSKYAPESFKELKTLKDQLIKAFEQLGTPE